MIYTGSYNNCKNCDIKNIVSISGDKGASIGFNGNTYSNLAPKLSFWTKWHDNIGKIPESKNNDFYIKEYYENVLAKLNPIEILNYLRETILLCYEDPEDFCHRHIVAAWLESELGLIVPEVKIIDNEIIQINRNQKIKEDYKRLILNKY